MALGLFALGVSSHYVKGTNALFLGYSAASTMPYAIDDPREKGKAKTDQLDISELIVDVFNGSFFCQHEYWNPKPASPDNRQLHC